jgi:hypothetical protein
MYLNQTYSKVHIDKHLSDNFLSKVNKKRRSFIDTAI